MVFRCSSVGSPLCIGCFGVREIGLRRALGVKSCQVTGISWTGLRVSLSDWSVFGAMAMVWMVRGKRGWVGVARWPLGFGLFDLPRMSLHDPHAPPAHTPRSSTTLRVCRIVSILLSLVSCLSCVSWLLFLVCPVLFLPCFCPFFLCLVFVFLLSVCVCICLSMSVCPVCVCGDLCLRRGKSGESMVEATFRY